MTVKPPPSHWQPVLFDVMPNKPLVRIGEARTRYGAVVDEAVRALLGLVGITNSGSHDIVFDAFHRPTETYCEIKSLHKSGKLPIYEWRRMKDRECGVPLVYVLGIHECRNACSLAEVWRIMSETLNKVVVLPACKVDLVAEEFTLRQVVQQEEGTRIGYKRKGYCDGYRNIPVSKLLEDCGWCIRHAEAELYGLCFKAEVNFHKDIKPWAG